MTIKEAIYQYFTQFLSKEKVYAKTGVVSNVNESARLCDVTPNDGSPIVYNVRLQVVKDATTGFVQIPKSGTECVITFINRSTAVLVSCKEITKLIVDADTIIQFNGGSLGGMVKINDLVTKLNNIETDINNLKTAFSTWVVVPSDGGGALKTITATWYSASITPTVKSDLENTKFKQ